MLLDKKTDVYTVLENMARLTWQRRSPTACPGVMDPPGPFAQLLDRRDQEIELWRRRSVEWDAERAQMEASWLH